MMWPPGDKHLRVYHRTTGETKRPSRTAIWGSMRQRSNKEVQKEDDLFVSRTDILSRKITRLYCLVQNFLSTICSRLKLLLSTIWNAEVTDQIAQKRDSLSGWRLSTLCWWLLRFEQQVRDDTVDIGSSYADNCRMPCTVPDGEDYDGNHAFLFRAIRAVIS